ncbi:MAG: hypothetical protein P8N00_02780 [Flavobacteriales bacterium]|nr:hypothetical protein [Flavobacteriales bacterium]
MNLELNKNEDKMKLMISEMNQKLNKIRIGGGKEKIEKQHKQGKLTARERIDFLVDDESDTVEIGSFVGDGMYEEYGGCPSGGVVVVFGTDLLNSLKIDDVVGAIPAHLVAGIWGTLAVGIFGAGSIGIQIVGILAAAVLVVPLSAIVFFILKSSVGLRMSAEEEAIGMDKAELTTEAYPEFR